MAALAITGAGAIVSAAAPASAETPTPASDAGIVPVPIAGNPTCSGLSGDLELKADNNPETGQFSNGELTVDIVVNADNSLDWVSNIGLDSVFVKGGNSGNWYVYDPPGPERTSDGGLFSPDNASGGPAGISHISFCYDLELTVAKSADTTFNRDWNWEINKSVDRPSLDLFEGDSGDVDWTVDVTKLGPFDSGWQVSGEIVIANPANSAATVTGITDTITPDGLIVDTDCSFPLVIAAHDDVSCSYSTPLSDGSDRTNTAVVTTSGSIAGGTATAPITFGAPTVETDAVIDVTDTNGMAWNDVDDTTTFPSYSETFTCNEDKGDHTNTATITQTGQSASATTTVNCYGLGVTKDAATSESRTFDWDIEKSANTTGLTLMPGQVYPVTFSVNVNATSTLGDFAVDGNIAVTNPAPIGVSLTGVTDVLTGGIAADVDCGVVFPYALASGATLNCTYSADLPDGSDRTNTATATTEFNVNYSGNAAVSFAGATVTNLEDCVAVSDAQYPLLASLFDADANGEFCLGENAN